MPIRKSAPVRQAFIAKGLQGESKRQIARDLGMGRNTVDRILSESQIEAAVAPKNEPAHVVLEATPPHEIE